MHSPNRAPPSHALYAEWAFFTSLLEEQVERSSELERRILRLLAVLREPVSAATLLTHLEERSDRGSVIDALNALRHRSLVERAEIPGGVGFTLQPVVLEYVTNRLVEDVCGDIARREPVILVEQPLIQAQTRDYIRRTQERMIGESILARLRAQHTGVETAQSLIALLSAWRKEPSSKQGYGPGNVVNLLRLLRGDLRGLDLSGLELRQAYLAELDAQDARLVDTHLSDSVLSEGFGFWGAVALSADGMLLAAGSSSGHIGLWRLADRTLLWTVKGHTSGVLGVAYSSDGRLIASSGADGTVQLWEANSGRRLTTLTGHTGTVGGVALSADGRLVATAGDDGTVRLWNSAARTQLAVLVGHSGAVWRVAVSADGRLAVSGADDGILRLWDSADGELIAVLKGHVGAIWRVAVSADGLLVASGGTDGIVRLWTPVSVAANSDASGSRESLHPAQPAREWRLSLGQKRPLRGSADLAEQRNTSVFKKFGHEQWLVAVDAHANDAQGMHEQVALGVATDAYEALATDGALVDGVRMSIKYGSVGIGRG